jgi:hypothetical protein
MSNVRQAHFPSQGKVGQRAANSECGSSEYKTKKAQDYDLAKCGLWSTRTFTPGKKRRKEKERKGGKKRWKEKVSGPFSDKSEKRSPRKGVRTLFRQTDQRQSLMSVLESQY